MSVIKLPVLYVSSRAEKELFTAFDDRATLSCIRQDSIKDMEIPIRLGRTRKLYKINEDRPIEIKEVVVLDFYVNEVLLSDEFLLVPDLSEEVVIGGPTLRKWRIKLDVEHGQVIVNPKVAELQLKVAEWQLV